MAKITFDLPDDMNDDLRSRIPHKKGELNAALTEAVRLYLSRNGKGKRREERK